MFNLLIGSQKMTLSLLLFWVWYKLAFNLRNTMVSLEEDFAKYCGTDEADHIQFEMKSCSLIYGKHYYTRILRHDKSFIHWFGSSSQNKTNTSLNGDLDFQFVHPSRGDRHYSWIMRSPKDVTIQSKRNRWKFYYNH